MSQSGSTAIQQTPAPVYSFNAISSTSLPSLLNLHFSSFVLLGLNVEGWFLCIEF